MKTLISKYLSCILNSLIYRRTQSQTFLTASKTQKLMYFSIKRENGVC